MHLGSLCSPPPPLLYPQETSPPVLLRMFFQSLPEQLETLPTAGLTRTLVQLIDCLRRDQQCILG